MTASRPVGGSGVWAILDTITALRDTITDDLLGPRCRCGLRVFPRDQADHDRDCIWS